MALTKQPISIDLAAGRDGGTDPKLVEGNLETINVIQGTEGAMGKRYGLSTDTPQADVQSADAIIMSAGDYSLLAYQGTSGGTAYSRSHRLYDANGQLMTPSGAAVTSVDCRTVALTDDLGAAQFDTSPYGSDIACGLENVILPLGSVESRSVVTPLVAPDEYRFAYAHSLLCHLYALSTGANIECNGANIVTDKSNTTRQWDACVVPTTITNVATVLVVAYVDSSGNDVIAKVYRNLAGVVDVLGTVEVTGTAADTSNPVTVFPVATNKFAVVWVDDASEDVYASVLTIDASGVPSVTVAATLILASSGAVSFTGAAGRTTYGATGGFVLFIQAGTDAASKIIFTRHCRISDLASTAIFSSPSIQNCGLYSKACPISSGFGATRIVALCRSSDQGRYYMLDSSQASGFCWSGYPHVNFTPHNKLLMNAELNSSGALLTGIERKSSTGAVQLLGLQFTFESKPVPAVASAGSMVVAGPTPSIIGQGLWPVALERPILSTPSPSNGAGTLTLLTEYSYTAVWVYTDSQGKEYISPHSTIQTLTLAGAEDTVTFTCEPEKSLPLAVATNIVGLPLQVKLKLYRNTPDFRQSYFFTVESTAVSYLDVNTITLVDVSPDTTIQEQEELNTTVENSVMPAFVHMAAWKTRVFGISAEDRNTIYYSQERIPNIGLEFSDLLYLSLSSEVELTALAPLGDRLVAFSKGGIWTISGDGPNYLAQGTFSTPSLLSNTVGCVDWRTLCVFETGLLFKSTKGWHRLDSGLNLTYVGEPVKDYEAYTVIQSAVDFGQPFCYILTSASTNAILIYDYAHNHWHTWHTGLTLTGIAQKQTVLDRGDFRFITNTAVYETDSALFDDNGTDYTMTIKTPWIKPGGAIGFQRVYEILLLGEWKSSHTMQVKVYYDYSETLAETKSVALTSAPTGGYLLRIQPAKQRCTAFRLTIEEVSPAGTKESFTLNGLRVIIGVKDKTPVPTARNI